MNTGPFKIVPGSMGSFLDPPGSPQHEWGVIEGRRDIPRAMMSLKGALADEWVPERIKTQVRTLLDGAPIKCTEEWLEQVYRHYRSCYSPDGVNRNASDCIIDPENKQPVEHHLAVLAVRQWFPDHEPRMDLIES